MKLSVALFLMGLSLITQLVTAQTGKIHVEVTNLKSKKGNMMIGIFKNEKDYVETKLFTRIILPATTSPLAWTFENIPVGTYAISVLHDENSNNEMDYNFIGLPKEHYGFSNNQLARFGLPKFESVKFSVHTNQTTSLVIKLQ